MEPRIYQLMPKIRQNGGDNPIVFLDTGAIIDFEKEARLWHRKDPSYGSKWYEELTKSFRTFISEGAMRETSRHHKECLVNRYPEISCETHEIMASLHQNYCKFLKEIKPGSINFDTARFDTYWASALSFENNEKKGVLDIISNVDKETVETATFLRYAFDPYNQPITSCTIISPDDHLVETVKTLTDGNPEVRIKFGDFGYNNIKVVNSRF